MATIDHSGNKPHHRFIDLTGQRFGRLVALRTDGRYRSEFRWRVCCDCGAEKTVLGTNLRSGYTQSCGCLHAEKTVAANTIHGMRYSAEFRTWTAIRDRCTNANSKSYSNYGGRGIKVCERWREFSAFYADMGPRPSRAHSIDRIDVNGNYEPGNCRWATASQQARNTRKTLYLEFRGKRLPMADIADMIGVTYSTLENRLRRGESGDRLFRQTRTRVGRIANHLATQPEAAPSTPSNM
jgi:hypothetical protein